MSVLANIAKALGGGSADPEQGNDLLAQAKDWFNQTYPHLKSVYNTYRANVWLALFFYINEPWVEYTAARNVVTKTEPNDDWVPQPKINRFSPAIDSVASIFNVVPEVEAVPKPDDDESKMGIASIASKLADHALASFGLRSDYKEEDDLPGQVAQLFTLAGTAFTFVYTSTEKIGDRPLYDDFEQQGVQCPNCDTYEKMDQAPTGPCPGCGGAYQVQPVQSQVPRLDPETQQPMTEPITKNKVCMRPGNPLYAIPRPGSTALANGYLLWAERMPIALAEQELGLEDLEPDNDQIDGSSMVYGTALDYFYLGFNSGTDKTKDSCLVVQIFIEPGKHKDFPDGLYAIYANKDVKKAIAWPFPDHPATKANYLNIPTLFFGRTVAFDVLEICKRINSYESIIELHAKTSAVEPIIVDKNTYVSEITGRSDKIIYWRSIGPGSKEPHRMAHGNLDEHVYKKIDELKLEIDNVTGAVKVFRGEQPGSVTAASAIATLKGQAEQMFAKPQQNWNGLWKETARKAVRLYQKRYTLAQLVEICGDDCLEDILAFQRCDLDTAVEFVATQHGLPRTRDERRQEMLDLFDRGALDVSQPDVRQKVFELFGETGLMKQFNEDAKRARAENQQIQKLGPEAKILFLPNIEDLSTHFAVHSEAIKNLDFDRWPPEAQQALIAHAELTKQSMQQMLAPPPGPPGAPPPAAPAKGAPPA